MTAAGMNPAIRVRGLGKTFGRAEVLRAVDLTVPEGAIFALVGANGAGKTTLIKVLMNLLRPAAGEAEVLGMDSRALQGAAFERIGYVSENQEMPDWMTVEELLAYVRPFYPRWDRTLEQQLVRQFDLPLKRKLKHLSRGMRMKAAFCSSLAYRPALVVLDEPFSGLDPLVRDELVEGLLERAPETTMLLSSHDLAEIESFASHVGYLEQGRMLFAEEMTVLSERVRGVTVTLRSPAALPAQPPPSWLALETADSVVRFVHSDYKGGATGAELAAIFPGARAIACDPMPLRAIFLAVARAGRTHEPSTSTEAQRSRQ